MKKLLTLLTFLGFFSLLYAKPVTEQTAKTAAEYFITNKTRSQLAALPNAGLKLVYKASLKASNPKEAVACYYVFNATASRGFIIVSADDNAMPILGYSDEKNFDPVKIPPSVTKWLEGYKSQLRSIIENKTEASAEIRGNWQELTTGAASAAPARSLNTVVVAPIMQTQWDQSPYYNALCPYDNQHSERTVTGCVATAMAQIMKRWNYPATGAGFHSYNTQSYGTLSANFGSTTYQWGSMPNSVVSSNNAVATLMYQVGVSVDMSYGVGSTGGSGAYVVTSASPVTNCAEYALKTYFGYDNTLQGIEKVNYTDVQWRNLLKTDLDAGRPVLYAGFGGGGGHCFVTDGYDDNNMFHFNWGWSGAYDGYFAISALNPGGVGTGGGTGGFNSGHQAVIGIKPIGGGGGGGGGGTGDIRLYSNIVAARAGNANTSSIYYGEAFDISVSAANYGATAFSGSYCAAIFDDGNNFVDFVDTLAPFSLASNTYFNTTFSSTGLFSMLPGTYRIGIFYRPSGGNWKQVTDNLTYTNLKQISVINPNDIELNKAITVSPGITLTQGQPASVNLNIINDGASTFTGQYDVSLYNLDGSFAQEIGFKNENAGLPSGYTYLSPFLTFSTNAITANPGTYLLAVEHKRTGGDWELTGSSYFQNPIKVTVLAASIQPDIFEVNNTAAQSYTLPVSFAGNTASVKTTGSNCHIGSDYDYYKIVLPAGYNYTINARVHDSYSSGNGLFYTLDALFSDSTSTPGSTWSDAYDDIMPNSLQVAGGTTVYFKVSPYFTGETGTYLLDMSISRVAAVNNVYTFTGNGNWNNAANWSGNTIPPSPLPSGKEIIINPQVAGECILNVPQTISTGAKLTVNPNAKFRIQGALTMY